MSKQDDWRPVIFIGYAYLPNKYLNLEACVAKHGRRENGQAEEYNNGIVDICFSWILKKKEYNGHHIWTSHECNQTSLAVKQS